ncbi:MAG: hypothetical protein ACU826_03160 [Gammaproteobacteria bacterium]
MNKIRRIVVIAGPSCAGKTYLMEKLKTGQPRLLHEKLKLGSAPTDFFNANKLKGLSCDSEKQLVIHYDLHRSWQFGRRGFFSDEALDILNHAEEIVFLTLWESPEILIQRCKNRSRHLRSNLNGLKRLIILLIWTLHRRKIRSYYEEPCKMALLYSDWFDFCNQYDSGRQWVVKSTLPENLVEACDFTMEF